MENYFDSDIHWIPFEKEFLSWLGTPYRHLTKVKQRGADCMLFIAAVLEELSIIRTVEYTYYPQDWHVHTHDERIIDAWNKHISDHLPKGISTEVATFEVDDYKTVDSVEFVRGDLLSFSTSKTGVSNHCALLTRDTSKMIHSINDRGVSYMPFATYWKSRMTKLMRLKWQ